MKRVRLTGPRPAAGGSTTRAIADIKIGQRHRKDLGDIAGLAASIAAIGLLNPITVDQDGRLLAGARRLAACKLLGMEKVEVRVMRRPNGGTGR
jgi:ParB family chromosome partitioning protein